MANTPDTDTLLVGSCRSTYDYERKLYNDHLESLQVMEKNYVSMAREMEKLRAELANTNNIDRRNGMYLLLHLIAASHFSFKVFNFMTIVV